MNYFISKYFFLLVVLLAVLHHSYGWDSFALRKARVVDARVNSKGYSRVLIRAPNLWDDHKIEDYDGLTHSLGQVVAESTLSINLPNNPYLIIVNLLSPHFESWKIEAEFDKNSKKVEMWGCTIQGTEVHPLEVYDSKVERAALLVDEWVDPMAKILLDIRRAMFDDNREEDVIVVIHCERGIDRTGQLSGAYKTSFMNETCIAALSEVVTNREMMYKHGLGLLWWCMHLAYIRDAGGVESLWSVPIAPFPKHLRQHGDFPDVISSSTVDEERKQHYAHAYDAGKHDPRWYLPAPKHGDGVLSDGAYLSNPAYEYLWYQSDATATVASLIADFHVWAINANHASELVETGDFMNPIFERDDESTVSNFLLYEEDSSTQDSSGLGALAISGIVVGSVSVGMAVISIGGLLLIGAAIVWRKRTEKPNGRKRDRRYSTLEDCSEDDEDDVAESVTDIVLNVDDGDDVCDDGDDACALGETDTMLG